MILTSGLIPVCVRGLWGYLDRHARLAIEPRFTFAAPFRNGLARVNSGGREGRPGEIAAAGGASSRPKARRPSTAASTMPSTSPKGSPP